MMKKKLCYLLSVIVALTLALSMIAGCGSSGGEEEVTEEVVEVVDITGAWDNDTMEISLVLEADGSGVMSSVDETMDITYEWDGETLILTEAESGGTLEGSLDGDGDLIFDETDGYFTPVDSPYYVPAEEEVEEVAMLGLANTAWDDGSTMFHFYDNSSVYATSGGDIYIGTYTWDGYNGEISMNGKTAALLNDADGFFMEGEDGVFYGLTYVGDADASLVAHANESIAGGASLGGAYDNDTVAASLYFNSDGTFEITTYDSYMTGVYLLASDGTLMLETDTYIEYGYFDSSDDTIVLEATDGYYYWVSEAYYVP